MSGSRPITVVLADDDPRVREDFAALLLLEPDIDVLALACDGREAVHECSRHRPDVAIIDVRMPVMNGIEATRRIGDATDQRSRVLVVTTFDLDEYVFGSVRAGAAGFLLKDRAPEDLAPAVRVVAAGDGIVSPRATRRLLSAFAAPRTAVAPTVLTEREIDVVRLLAKGLSNEDIADRARISRATVKTHVSSVLAKLGLTSRLQIVVWAFENGVALADAS